MRTSVLITTETQLISYGPIHLYRFQGRNNTGANVYLQAHEKHSLANGDVPAKAAFEATANTWFDWEFGKGGTYFSRCIIGMSSTQPSYTALTNAGVDGTIEYDTNFDATDTDFVVFGDRTTGVASKQAWSSLVGGVSPLRLCSLMISNNSIDPVYPVIQASDAALTTDTTALRLPVLADATTSYYLFGYGHVPHRRDSASSIHTGCTIRLSSTATRPYTFISATDFNIEGIYAGV